MPEKIKDSIFALRYRKNIPGGVVERLIAPVLKTGKV
jgi:hypothetical protein